MPLSVLIISLTLMSSSQQSHISPTAVIISCLLVEFSRPVILTSTFLHGRCILICSSFVMFFNLCINLSALSAAFSPGISITRPPVNPFLTLHSLIPISSREISFFAFGAPATSAHVTGPFSSFLLLLLENTSKDISVIPTTTGPSISAAGDDSSSESIILIDLFFFPDLVTRLGQMSDVSRCCNSPANLYI